MIICDPEARGWLAFTENVPTTSDAARTTAAMIRPAAAAPTSGTPERQSRVRSMATKPAMHTDPTPSTAVWKSPRTPAARHRTATTQPHPKRPERSPANAQRHSNAVPTCSGPRRKTLASTWLGSPKTTTTVVAAATPAMPRRPSRASSTPTTTTSSGDHRRNEEQEHVSHAGHQLDEHVHDGIHRPEGVERERPAMEREIARTHGLSLQHNGGSVRVSGERVPRRHVQERHQRKEGAPGGRRNDQARSSVLADRAMRRGGCVPLERGRASGRCVPRPGDAHRNRVVNWPAGRSRRPNTTPNAIQRALGRALVLRPRSGHT